MDGMICLSLPAKFEDKTMPSLQTPAVSVVVPCYNGGRYIDGLLATLAAQTFRDFEIIIVDDGSNEQTRAKLATLDPSIKVMGLYRYGRLFTQGWRTSV